MRVIEQINSIEDREKIAFVIRSTFAEEFSKENVEEWIDIILNEMELSIYDDCCIYRIDSGKLVFAQNGEKEYYHDGSYEPGKYVSIESISEEEYNEAKKYQCVLESTFHNYRNGWLEHGEERFFTYWQGRNSDYIYYAKNLSGILFVKVTIESH